MKCTYNIIANEIQIPEIIKNFHIYNKILSSNNLEWFMSNNKFSNINSRKITQSILNKAIKQNCYIGLVDIGILVSYCIRKDLE